MKVMTIEKKNNLTKKHYLKITFEFHPNFSGRNWKKLFLPDGKNRGKTAFFSALEETGEPWTKAEVMYSYKEA